MPSFTEKSLNQIVGYINLYTNIFLVERWWENIVNKTILVFMVLMAFSCSKNNSSLDASKVSFSAIQSQELSEINQYIGTDGSLSLSKLELDELLNAKTINQIQYQKLALLIK